MSRLRWALVAMVLSLGALPAACTDGDVRARIVQSWVDTIILPGYRAFADAAADLDTQAAALCAAPSSEALAAARAGWQAARGAWKRMEVFAFGPYTAYPERLGPNTDFWPVRPERIAEVMADGEPLTTDTLAGRGAAARGLPVIEHLLYAEVAGPDAFAARRCEYLVAATGDLVGLGEAMHRAWHPEHRGYAGALTAPGTAPGTAPIAGAETFDDVQAVISEVVNRMAFTVENIRRDKLGRPLGETTGGDPQPAKVESPSSDRSIEDIRDALHTVLTLYTGVDGALGLAHHPRVLAADTLDPSFRGAFRRADAALLAISGPLDEAIFDDPASVAAASEALATLQRVIQTEVSAALAVSLAFNDSDGD